jgi:hypothetical protein
MVLIYLVLQSFASSEISTGCSCFMTPTPATTVSTTTTITSISTTTTLETTVSTAPAATTTIVFDESYVITEVASGQGYMDNPDPPPVVQFNLGSQDNYDPSVCFSQCIDAMSGTVPEAFAIDNNAFGNGAYSCRWYAFSSVFAD